MYSNQEDERKNRITLPLDRRELATSTNHKIFFLSNEKNLGTWGAWLVCDVAIVLVIVKFAFIDAVP